jgi:hypothetical protein
MSARLSLNRPPLDGPAVGVLLIALSLIGCDSGPRVEPGPVPWTGPGERPVRLRVMTGRGTGRSEATYWDEGAGPVWAGDRVSGLMAAIPEDLLGLAQK